MCCRKIKLLCENVLSTGDDVAGVVNIFCWVDVDVGESVGYSRLDPGPKILDMMNFSYE
jgi:hypothetical protein